MRRRRQAKVGAAEEEPRMRCTVRREGMVAEPPCSPFAVQKLVSVVVVARDPLPAVAEDAAPVVPLSQAVEDDDLVPERPFGLNGDDVANAKITIRKISSDVREEFEARFIKTPPLPLTDAVAWNLLGEAAHELFRARAGSLDFAAAVANARSFNGKRFTSLADHFGISVSAMAIRLQELDLVTD